jgi:O-antigen biosynthesis protein
MTDRTAPVVPFPQAGLRRAVFVIWCFYRRLQLPLSLRRGLNLFLQRRMPMLFAVLTGLKNEGLMMASLPLQLAAAGPSGVRVSVVMPVYDRTDILREAIESVLAQSYPHFELILVLDGSPEETRRVAFGYARDPKVRIFEFPLPSGNAVRPRNKGIKEARGDYIAFLDSDDIAMPERLALSVSVLDRDEADVVYGAWRARLDGTRQVDGLIDGQLVVSPDCDAAMLREICVPCLGTVMLRRSLILSAGYLKPVMQYREDHELWARLADHGARFKALTQPLVTLRLHAGNNELNFKRDDDHWRELFLREFRHPGPSVRKIAFLVDGLGVSGGMAMVVQHAMHQQRRGHDVLLVNIGADAERPDWWRGCPIPIVRLRPDAPHLLANIDILVATFWTTAAWLERIEARRRIYYVQSDERLFYEEELLKRTVAETYRHDWEYVVVSEWLRDMLGGFGQEALVVPNGVDPDVFFPGDARREGRFRVLLEGAPGLPIKGMADAYEAVAELDCEIWIVSPDGEPPAQWRRDKFFEAVPGAEMQRIYAACDVLVKMSRVESFCLPALEAMACGCCVVIAEVAGGIEYLRDDTNALVTPAGDIDAVRRAVARLMADGDLRERLRRGGLETAARYTIAESRQAFDCVIDRGG